MLLEAEQGDAVVIRIVHLWPADLDPIRRPLMDSGLTDKSHVPVHWA